MGETPTATQNENTADIQPTIEQSGSGGFASFDELEAVDRYKEREKEASQSKEKADAKPKENAKEPKANENKSKKQPKETSGDEESEDDSESSEDEAGIETKAAAAPKLVKAKVGDKEIDLDLGAMIPVTINGKPGEATLEDLRNNYAGKVAWDARFSQLGHKEQAFEKIKGQFTEQAREWFALSKVDGMQALMKMAEMNGEDPITWRKNFMEKLMPGLEKYRDMTDDERAQADRDFELEQLKRENESHRRSKEEQAAISALTSKVESLQQTHQIDSETFAVTFNRLEGLQAKGQLKGEITPELVAQTVVSGRLYDSIESAFTELNLNVEESVKEKMTSDLMAVASNNPDLTPQDLKEIAMEVWGKTKAQNLSRKLAKTQGDPQKKAKARPTLNPMSEPISFDDL